MRCSIKEEASRDIEKMMEILPLQGQDTSNPSNRNTSSTSSMSMSHPKILECEINKNHVCLYGMKFHRELIFFDLLKNLIRKTISNFPLFLEGNLLRK
jgi:hypothetical protein